MLTAPGCLIMKMVSDVLCSKHFFVFTKLYEPEVHVLFSQAPNLVPWSSGSGRWFVLTLL